MEAAHDITRYTVEREEHESPCEHEMCWQFHQRFMQRYPDGKTYFDESAGRCVDRFHMKVNRYWIIVDTETHHRAFDGDSYETKREAQTALIRNTDRLMREVVASRSAA